MMESGNNEYENNQNLRHRNLIQRTSDNGDKEVFENSLPKIFTQNELPTNQLQKKIKELGLELSEKINSQCLAFVQDVNQEIESILPKSNDNSDHYDSDKTTKKAPQKLKKSDDLPEKEFVVRESLLTELLEISHIKTIYHIFVAILVILFVQAVLYDLVETGKFNLDFSMIKYAFGKLQYTIMIWICMKFAVILLVFPMFHYWAYNRKALHSHGITDAVFLTLFAIYLTIFFILPPRAILIESIPPASAAILLCEQIRLMMKSYAFIRSNVPRALRYVPNLKSDNSSKPSGDSNGLKATGGYSETTANPESPCPNFSNFLYFLFAPTLVYRDNYPRMKGPIRWNYVTSNFVQVVACLFYTYYIFQRFCVPVFQRFGHEPISYRGLLLSVFGCMMPGTLVMIINFYLLLHAWMNAFAEMLRFGDRMFYKDWWNSTTYANYYRTWNIVVHDWLYTYIYRDLYKFFKPNRRLPMIFVFVISALIHEYIVSLMFSYFYPVMLVLFLGMGVFFVFLTDKRQSRFWNVFFWVSLFIGPGIFMTLYCTEIYARTNCPQYYESAVLDFFVPRSWVCYHPIQIKPQ